ncbi:MAG: hypothetical protein QM691_13125 [Opitutaceae bacterium]
MKTLFRGLRVGFFAAEFLLVLGFAPALHAAEEYVGTSVATIAVSPKLNETDVESAITQSLTARKWIVRDKSDGQIVAHYERGKNVATLTIRYDAAKIEIFAVGQARGGGLPMRWIENLRKDIDVFLGRAVLTK